LDCGLVGGRMSTSLSGKHCKKGKDGYVSSKEGAKITTLQDTTLSTRGKEGGREVDSQKKGQNKVKEHTHYQERGTPGGDVCRTAELMTGGGRKTNPPRYFILEEKRKIGGVPFGERRKKKSKGGGRKCE